MMNIRFTPQSSMTPLLGVVAGDVITLNGEVIDLSPLGEGATLPADAVSSPWVVGEIERRSGEIYLTLICPHGANAPHETRFPSGEYIAVEGDIPFPTYDVVPVEEPIIVSDTLEA